MADDEKDRPVWNWTPAPDPGHIGYDFPTDAEVVHVVVSPLTPASVIVWPGDFRPLARFYGLLPE